MRSKKFNNVTQLSFLPHVFPINIYVVEEDDFLIVIDMGIKYFIKDIQKICKNKNKPVKFLLLTHAHSDHVMGIQAFKKQFPAAKVMISKKEHDLILNDFNFDVQDKDYLLKGDYSKCDFSVDGTLENSDNVGTLKVIATPGHSVGSISFWNEKYQYIIVGDAFQTKGRVAVSGDKVKTFPFPAMATGNIDDAIISAKKIVLLNPSTLAVGHGNILINPLEKLNLAISRFEDERKNNK